MAVSKGRTKGKAKVAARRQAAQRGKDLEGVQFVRTVLPIPNPEVAPWRDLVLHTIDESLQELAENGADTLALTVVTIGTQNPHAPGELVVEVKSRPKA
jgi:hypothetical protein